MPSLFFDNDLERITVIASDPEARSLGFIWQLPPFALYSDETSTTDGVFVSRCDVEWADELIGQDIVLTIVDAPEGEDPQSFDLVWNVESL